MDFVKAFVIQDEFGQVAYHVGCFDTPAFREECDKMHIKFEAPIDVMSGEYTCELCGDKISKNDD